MRLTGSEIACQVRLGNIVIEPFNRSRLGPNSYDVTLGPTLATYRFISDGCQTTPYLDSKVEHELDMHELPVEGLTLQPHMLYLGHTNEVVGVPADASQGFVPCLEGKSGVGRLGVQIHATAGSGADGFVGDWTLEITVTHPVRVYPGQLIGQVYFEPVMGARTPYVGNYQGQRGPVPSKLWRSFLPS